MKKITFIILLLLALSVNVSPAQDQAPAPAARDQEEAMVEEAYVFPVVAPEFSLSGGYRFVGLSGSERADEYEYLHNAISLGGEARVFSFPHRFHLEFDVKNKKDYFGDTSYSYEDVIVFRGVTRSIYHNLEHINLIDLNTATASPGAQERDPGRNYGVNAGITNLSLRLKTPDFPFHLYAEGMIYTKDGSQQQRSLLGAAYFNNTVRTSQKRLTDIQSTAITFGTNSHLGPVELDFSHSEKRLDISGDRVFFDTYANAGFGPPGATRFGGVFPHNFLPEFRSVTNTLKLHTSYTGGLVASATFSKTDKENRDSGAKTDFFIGAGDVTWVPMTQIAVFLKYRHKELDSDSPETVSSFPGLCSPANNAAGTYTCVIRPAMSTATDTLAGAVRYRLAPGITLRAEYSYEDIRRKDADAWERPDSTQKQMAAVSADIRIIKGLKVSAKYIHRDQNDPAYNIDPDRSDEGRLSLSWTPVPQISAMLSYGLVREKRDEMHIVEATTPATLTLIEDRRVKRDRLLGSVTVVPLKDLSVTLSYAYMYHKIEQEIEYHRPSPLPPAFDPDAEYKSTAQSYGLDLSYMPKNSITLNAGVNQVTSKGSFSPTVADLLQPVSVASFSELKTRETTFSAGGEYRFRGGYAAGVRYKYSAFDDIINNRYDDVKDGNAHIIFLTFSRKW